MVNSKSLSPTFQAFGATSDIGYFVIFQVPGEVSRLSMTTIFLAGVVATTLIKGICTESVVPFAVISTSIDQLFSPGMEKRMAPSKYPSEFAFPVGCSTGQA